MKHVKLFFAGFSLLAFSELYGQAIPNNSFENWSIVSGELMPDNWSEVFVQDTAVLRTTNSYTGNYAVELIIKSAPPATINGVLVSGPSSNPTFNISTRPAKLTGYYIFMPVGNDTSGIAVSILDNNYQLLGQGQLLFTAQTSVYTYFEIPIGYSNTTSPPVYASIMLAACMGIPPDLTVHTNTSFIVDELNFTGIVGTPEQSFYESQFSVFPNPSSGSINIIDAVPGSVFTLLDLSGQAVKEGVIENSTSKINTADVAPGIYFLEMENNGRKSTRKVIVE
jgi:hypothetical protein